MVDRVRELRDEVIRQIEKRSKADPLPGVIADKPDTVAHTASVQVGTQMVVAAYRGATPEVGEQVWVQRVGAGYVIFQQIPKSAVNVGAAGAPSLLQQTAPGNFGRFTVWGHSWVDIIVGSQGQLRMRDSRFADRLAALLGVEWPNYRNRGHYSDVFINAIQPSAAFPGGIPGYSAIQSKVRPEKPTSAPYVATHGHHLIVEGINDVATAGAPFTTQRLNMWSNAWRGSIARLWAGGVFEPTHASFVETGAWTNLVCPWDGTKTIRQTVVAGARTDWTIPADYPGGHVNVRLVGERQGVQAGATAVTITAPPLTTGGANQTFTLVTDSACIAANNNSMVCQRIAVPKTGTTQNLRIAATTLAAGGRLAVDCCEIEDPTPPMVMALTIAKPKSWGDYGGPSAGTFRTGTTPPLGAQPEDAWLIPVNAATTAVFAEFGTGPLALLNADVFMDGTLFPDRYLDKVHPNEIGDAYIASAVNTAFATLRATYAVNAASPHNVESAALWSVFN